MLNRLALGHVVTLRGSSFLARGMCTAAATADIAATAATAAKSGSRKLKGKRPVVVKQRERNGLLEERAEESKLGWRIMGSTILHRYPVVTPDPFPWETEMWDLQDLTQAMRREALMDQIKNTDAQLIPDMDPTYDEILESMPFQPAPRTTEADTTNDRHSTNRRLQDSLFLVVKRNRKVNPWQFPQGKLQADETLRAAGERVVDRAVGHTNRWFISNSPVGHYCYAYPPEVQQKRENFGAKVYFYRTQLIAGNVKLQTKLYTDYAWIARDEVGEYFDPETADFLSYLLPL